MGGTCGTCTMCCKIMAVSQLHKPKNTWCEHCSVGVGCKIYPDRPSSCQSFRCIWLQTQDHVPPLPMNLRPDKCKVVLHTSADEKSIVAKVDPKYPNAWKEKGVGLMLGTLAEKCFVLVDNGKQYWLLRDGKARQARMSAADDEGNETFLGYIE